MKETKNTLILGFGFFALLFGAGNLLFPPILGITGGKFWWLSLFGFILSDVLFALMALFAFSRYSSLADFGNKMGKRFMTICYTLIVAIFALFVFPRTASMTYELSIQPFVSADFNSWIFYILFFFFALLLTLKPSRIFDMLGIIFAPILIITILGIIVVGITNLPTHYATNPDTASIFRFGFTSGYQTADTLGALFQASLAAAILHTKGYIQPKEKGRMILKAGLISMILFVVLYFGLAYVGAKIGGTVGADISTTQALRHIAISSVGSVGAVFLGITVLITCFTTGLGLLGIIAHFASDHLFPKTSYRLWTVIFAIIGAIIAHQGVDFILLVAGPVLLIVYPFIICLVILEITGVKNQLVFRATCITALLFAIIDSLNSLGVSWAIAIENAIPLGNLGFLWVLPALLVFILTNTVLFAKRRLKNAS